ncbi:hypothetical protein [Lactiplantibacillus fabifermentans]|nr:hypothetical protein [Lactiplantibacillus fabifermentans]
MKFEKLQRISNYFVNLFFLPLIFISLLGALGQIIGNFNGMRVKVYAVVVAIIALTFMLASSARGRKWGNKIIGKVKRHILRQRRVYLVILIVLTLLWQIWMVMMLSGTSAWDPVNITRGAMGHAEPKLYFSYNSNTLLLMYIERLVWLIIGQPGFQTLVLVLNFGNIILIDLALVLMVSVTRRWFNHRTVPFLIFFCWTLFMVTPWVALTYTDDWAFLLAACNLWLVSGLTYYQRTWQKYILAGGIGISLMFSYFMKPPLVIFYIAVLIVLFFQKGCQKWHRPTFQASLAVIIGLLCATAFYAGMQTYTHYQHVVTVDARLAHPATHFMAMGMTGNGAYNNADVEMDQSIKSPTKRQKANMNLIKQRLHAFGPVNYLKFLVQKQVNNTADGSFGWGADGIFLIVNHVTSARLNHTLPRVLFTDGGVVRLNSYEYRFYAQLLWSIVLLLLLLAGRQAGWKSQLFKYGIVGGMMFLLLFEGGRSRYLIQFLPMYFILAAVSAERVWRQVESWQKNHRQLEDVK